MATYIQGLTDYIPEIQPFQPDLNFYSNVMQTRQTRYDDAKNKINDLYGSLLYADMTNPENVKRRENYFKVIDQDIKKISGLDLSLQQNVDQALNVFKGFHDDKYMPYDMAWTKKYKAAVSKHNYLKNCNDPKKCGDMKAWNEGLQDVMYKREAFEKAGLEETLNMAAPSYTAYYDWKPAAIKLAKEQGYGVSIAKDTGRWVVTDSGGELVTGGLYKFFSTLYKDDPRVKDNYRVMASVNRQNDARSNAFMFNGSVEEAEKDYALKIVNKGLKDSKDDLDIINKDFNQVTSKFNKLEQKRINSHLTPDEEKVYQTLLVDKDALNNSKINLESEIAEIEGNIDANNIENIIARADGAAIASYRKRDMIGLAEGLAGLKVTRKLDVNPYTKMYEEHALDKKLAAYRSLLDRDNLKYKHDLDLDLKELELGIKSGQFVTQDTYEIKALPGSTAMIDLEEDPEYVYRTDNEAVGKMMVNADGTSKYMLYNLFDEARKAYKSNKADNAGAGDFLAQFGKNWENIRSQSDLNKALVDNKKSAISLFEAFIKNSSDKKNPAGDYAWSKPFMQKSRSQMESVRLNNEAYHAVLAANLRNITKTAQKMKDLKASNRLGWNTDFLITKNGIIADEATFTKKYIDTNRKRGIVVDESDAANAYEDTKEYFFKLHNEQGSSITKGRGLTGTGMTSGNALQIPINTAIKNQDLKDVISTTKEALSQFDNSVAVIGDMTEDSYDEGDNAEVRDFLNYLMNKSASGKKEDATYYDAVLSLVAADDKNTSGITFKSIPQDIINDYIGSDKSKKVFFDKHKNLANGVTLFWDNTKITSPFAKKAEMNPLETVLRYEHLAVSDAYEETAGTVTYRYDEGSNKVSAMWHLKGYDSNGDIAYTDKSLGESDIGNIKNMQKSVEKELYNQQIINLKVAEEIGRRKKMYKQK